MLAAACSPPAAAPQTEASASPTVSMPRAETAAAPTGCAVRETRTLEFSAPAPALDQIDVHAFGPTCAQATVTVTLRNANGDALWARAEPYAQLTLTDPSMPAASPEIMRQTLATMLAGARLDRTSSAPDWPAEQPSLAVEDGALNETQLPREFYLQLRARALAMLCIPFGQETESCIYYDSESVGVGVMFNSAS